MAPRTLSGAPCRRSFNAVHGSDAPDTAAVETDFFFSNPLLGKCDLARNTSLGIIKPHVVTDGLAGLALDIVQENFEVTALRLCTLDKPSATEFYEVCEAGGRWGLARKGGRASDGSPASQRSEAVGSAEGDCLGRSGFAGA